MLDIRQKNNIPSEFMFYLRISAAHKLPTRVSCQLFQPAFTHVGRIYPRLVGMRVQKGHLYMDTLRPTFVEFPYEGKSLSASLQHRRPTSYLHKEILRREKSNFGRRIFIFILPIRNKSPFSGKIITSFKIEMMSLNLLAIWPKHKIEMHIIYDDK